MRLRSGLVWLLLALLCSARAALAQYGGGGIGGNSYTGGSGSGSRGFGLGTNDLVSSGGGESPEDRYKKAQHGTNISEWARRLNDDDPSKRLDAVKSFGESNDPKAIDYLIQAVNDPDPRVEAKAVDYLGRLHASDSTLFLIQKLFTVGTRDKLRQRIVMTLGKIGDPRATKPLLQYVSQDVSPDIRGAGIYAIGEIADRSISEELQRFSDEQTDPRLKRLAHEALVKVSTRVPAPTTKASMFPTALEAALSTERPQ
jgi:HEAT repeat protein